MSALARERIIAINAVRQACKLTRAVFSELVSDETITKKDKSPVTVADFGAQAIINSILQEAFPNDPIVGEEDAADLKTDSQQHIRNRILSLVQSVQPESTSLSSEEAILSAIDRGNYGGGPKGRMWALDPVDGTKGFLRGGQYAVCLALIIDGKVKLGVMGCPNLPLTKISDTSINKGCLFVAIENQGAFQSNLWDDNSIEIPIRMGDISINSLKEATFCESIEAGHSSHDDSATIARILGISKPSVRMDSQAKYCSISRGDGHIYLRLPVDEFYQEKIWDHASGSILVTEAGGKVSDIYGKPLDFSKGRTLSENKGVIASHISIHNRVIEAVKEALKI